MRGRDVTGSRQGLKPPGGISPCGFESHRPHEQHKGTALLGALSRTAVAAVWLHQGLWCKVLAKRPDHTAIVADVPGIGPQRARAATVAIGVGETALAAWVLSGRAPRRAAATQTALLAGMNAGGLLFARERIPGAGQMLARNAGLLALAWSIPFTGRDR